ncbi:MAG: hypothetical protein M1829_002865 [Trizodia sp. TS-e1964]|nr:MAG: hypothetical protein M1829_002865 [Trizodia sp. TS-e1964]
MADAMPSCHSTPMGSSRDSAGHFAFSSAPIISSPMSIPNSRDAVPPPLPPPRDMATLMSSHCHSEHSREFLPGSVRAGSSLHGYHAPKQEAGLEDQSSQPGMRHDIYAGLASSTEERHGPSKESFRDEGYVSFPNPNFTVEKSVSPITTPAPSHGTSFPHSIQDQISKNAFKSSVHGGFKSSSHDYDKSVLAKIGRDPNASPRIYRPSGLGAGSPDASPPISKSPYDFQRRPSSLKTLSMPSGSLNARSTESPLSQWARDEWSGGSRPISAISPGQSLYGSSGFMDFRNPKREGSKSSFHSLDRDVGPFGPLHRSGSVSFDDASSIASRSNRGSCDHSIIHDADSDLPMEEAGITHLNIRDRSPPQSEDQSPNSSCGKRRRTSSPPRSEDRLTHNTTTATTDFLRRSSQQISANRGSPVHRFPPSLSSASSISSIPGNGSFASTSTLSTTASSLTSLSSSIDHTSLIIPNQTDNELMHLKSSKHVPIAPAIFPSTNSTTNHKRTNPDPKAGRKSSVDTSTKNSNTRSARKLHGLYICECCPKKPKKFDSQQELMIHEMEKQYTCTYCHNRFKNKNEAERHQNSLHLRRHSWSCAALSGFEAAFHPLYLPSDRGGSPDSASTVDVCGYCGLEFNTVASASDWSARVEHLTSVHKYGECNQVKKFFRADHFRQHLKHSHAGTSGRWTNMLENACMKEEPAPEPINHGSAGLAVCENVIDEGIEE